MYNNLPGGGGKTPFGEIIWVIFFGGGGGGTPKKTCLQEALLCVERYP